MDIYFILLIVNILYMYPIFISFLCFLSPLCLHYFLFCILSLIYSFFRIFCFTNRSFSSSAKYFCLPSSQRLWECELFPTLSNVCDKWRILFYPYSTSIWLQHRVPRDPPQCWPNMTLNINRLLIWRWEYVGT